MQELEKILEEIDEEIEKERAICKDLEGTSRWRVYEKAMKIAKDIISKHMNDGERFEFDFSNVKSFDCQCGRHFVNTGIEEVQQYREIGTVEECREAVEKQVQKKCAIESCPDHTHYKCPSCGQIELSIYKHGFPRLGRITKYCENCGQALIDEN